MYSANRFDMLFSRSAILFGIYYGGKDTTMSIVFAVVGGSVWSLIVYVVCTWLGE